MERIAFLFTGQGAQYTGMAKGLFDKYAIARETFEEASEILGFDLAKLCFEGSLVDLAKTENAQPAILTASVAAYRVYMQEIGIPPEYCAGHSLGEYSALTCAGAIRFSQAVKLVRARGLLCGKVADSGIGGMTIVEGVTQAIIEEECKKFSDNNQFAAINTYNEPAQFSIAGHQEVVEQVESALLDRGANITPLMLSAPYHSMLMETIAEELHDELHKCSFKKLRWPVISNVTGLPYRNMEEIPESLALQIVKPVQWISTMRYLFNNGITIAVEMGPKNVLTNLVKMNTPEIKAFCYGQPEHRNTLYDILESKRTVKKVSPTVVTRCLAAAVATSNQGSSSEDYNIGVVKPYREIEKMQSELNRQGALPTYDQMKHALKMLRVVFNTKRVPVKEQEEWFERILDETLTSYMFKDFVKSEAV